MLPEHGNLSTSALGLSIKYFSKERENEYKSVLVHYSAELGETSNDITFKFLMRSLSRQQKMSPLHKTFQVVMN